MEATISEGLKIQDMSDSFSESICAPAERSTQCFMCSRIYFGRDLGECPHCGSRSVACYTTEDLTKLARDSAS